MFENFPQSPLDIIAPDGTVRASTKGLFHKGKITIPDTSVTILPGDEIRRVLPNGQEEAFNVLDPTYHAYFHGIPARYDVTVERKGTFAKGSGGNYTINVSGPNSRVNLHSIDQSRNVVSSGDGNVFAQIADVLNRQISETDERTRLLALLETMENNSKKKEFLPSYQAFVAAAANHMTILAPFIPALTSMLS
jgi:hypothetical protein